MPFSRIRWVEQNQGWEGLHNGKSGFFSRNPELLKELGSYQTTRATRTSARATGQNIIREKKREIKAFRNHKTFSSS
jgi:hypothetical protein